MTNEILDNNNKPEAISTVLMAWVTRVQFLRKGMGFFLHCSRVPPSF
jgi:hypothetical protein